MSTVFRPSASTSMIFCSLFLAALSACGGGGGSAGSGDAAVAGVSAVATAAAAAPTTDTAAASAVDGADITVMALADAGSTPDSSATALAAKPAALAALAALVAVPLAAEGQTFQVAGPTVMRFGAGSTWVTKTVIDAGTCSAAFFGAGASSIARGCEAVIAAAASTGNGVVTAGMPAAEGSTFYVLGTRTVQYGANGKTVNKSVSGRVTCSNAVFGDPNVGTVKTCQVAPSGAAVLSMMASLDTTKLAAAVAGYATPRVMAANVADPSQNPAPSDIGDFREYCEYSHMSYDDPIAAPGSKSAHLHTFLGNTGVNANSTAASIANTGNSTCAGGTLNRTAYWVPSLIDTQDGTPQEPIGSLIYYKQGYNYIPAASIKPFPAGLRMVAGDAASSGSQGNAGFTCYKTDGTWTSTKSIPTDCPAGATLTIGIAFPQCWDGINLDSPDHKSHMAFPGIGCPATHPVPLTGITFNINYKVGASGTSHWRLSSDNYDRSIPGGYSSHADWFNGWNTDIMNVWTTRCINASMDCHAFLIGDGRILY